MADLFQPSAGPEADSDPARRYTAADIEVLEGLEPVRKRPGMYIGGTDEAALHHLAAEILDNAMDEAVAGHATRIEFELNTDGAVTVTDNGRGIPVDAHPRFKDKSALEVIFTTLHSGGKFGGKAYATSGGLHGVGSSVVNALSRHLLVEVARDRRLWRMEFSRGQPLGPLADLGPVMNRRGTLVRFAHDEEIFGTEARLQAHRLFNLARSKAFLFKGVSIRWKAAPERIDPAHPVPAEALLHYPGGLKDFLTDRLEGRSLLGDTAFAGEAQFPEDQGRVEWAIGWVEAGAEGAIQTWCNTIPTPQGGSHELGLRAALTRAIRSHGEMTGNRRIAQVTTEDVMASAVALLSCFLREPQFQGQTKEKLASPAALRLVDQAIKDRLDHWLASDPARAQRLLESIIEAAEERLRRRKEKETARKSLTRRLRLPGKLTDCAVTERDGTEIFIVEGDSAGGSAKQARDRRIQAILPLRGKILNVASAGKDKSNANQELNDLVQALGCGRGRDFDLDRLRYERVIIMTDADVDGAHIASLLITFFYREMPALVRNGHLYLALPPLYRIAQGSTIRYAMDEADRDRLLAEVFTGRGKIEISRFKGLGEMPASQLKETTMDPARRTLVRVALPAAQTGGDPNEAEDAAATMVLVERLMGKRAEERFRFIQENARFVEELDI